MIRKSRMTVSENRQIKNIIKNMIKTIVYQNPQAMRHGMS